MQLSVTFRHMEASEPLRTYVQERTGKLTKYIDKPMESQVTLSVEKFRQIADVVINANGIRIAGQEEHEDMYAAIDLVMEKIERQVKKLQGKDQETQTCSRPRPKMAKRNLPTGEF